MFHRLQFREESTLDLHRPGNVRLEQVIVQEGQVVEAEVRPQIIEIDGEFVECADLFLPGGEVLLEVRMGCFIFL